MLMINEIGVPPSRMERNRVLSYSTNVSPETNLVTLSISGSADVLAIDEVVRACSGVIDLHPKALAVDLSGITFICSTAIGKLISMNHDIRADGGRMTLVRVPRSVLTLLRHAKLDGLFDIEP